MYQYINDSVLRNLETGVQFPVADGNADYEAYKQWLAEGNTPEAAQAPSGSAAIVAQIGALEAENPITHRNLRELSLAVAQIIAQVEGVDPLVNPGVRKLKDVDDQIAALRALL